MTTATPHHFPDGSWREQKAGSPVMFDAIAARYDLLNAVLSCGVDKLWRRELPTELPQEPARLRLLDAATGTGEQLLELLKTAPGRFERAVGLDPSPKMLALARRKRMPRLLGCPRPEWVAGSVMKMPFADGEFDVVTMSFGIRNVPEPLEALKEIYRVLCGNRGRVVILEFGLPSGKILRTLYLLYFRHALPAIGRIVSGHPNAYRYLNQTVEAFPYGEDFLKLLRGAGFEECRWRPLTWGIAAVYTGCKVSKEA